MPRDGRDLFAYGTLMSPDVMRAVCGILPGHEPARLRAFARRPVRGQVFPGLVAADTGVTDGILYRGLPPRLWSRLDAFESDLYERRVVEVTTEAGLALAAEAYVIPAGRADVLIDGDWDFEAFLAKHLRLYLDAIRRPMPDRDLQS